MLLSMQKFCIVVSSIHFNISSLSFLFEKFFLQFLLEEQINKVKNKKKKEFEPDLKRQTGNQ